ncbi:MAG: DUF4430 domain-containing protein [Clostridia bacterium]|nr:DUF4430 domain-containing protein [Clostridia bacterium]
MIKCSAADEAESITNGIINYKLKEAGVSSVQQWINGKLSENSGLSSEWYAVTLSQYGSYDFSVYKNALKVYLEKNNEHTASSRQKYALALIAAGGTDEYIYTTLNNSIGKQGIMSWIYGLHLLNNGYVSNDYSVSAVKQKLLFMQLGDGGWALSGTNSDVDITAMAVQALAPYYKDDFSVKSAVDKALALLSDRQQAEGDYLSYGLKNVESTAQVLVALSSLGIDCKVDSRFIKNGNTLFSAISQYRLSDGSFCHIKGGGYNAMATTQVFYSMVSYNRMKSGKTPLYILDARNPSGLKIPHNTTSLNPAEKTASANSEFNGSSSQTTAFVTQSSNEQSLAVQNSDSSSKEQSKTEASCENKSDLTLNSKTNSAETSTSKSQKNGGNYKLWVSVAIAFFAVGVCLVLYLLKKRNIKNFIVVSGVAALAVILVITTNFQTKENYYKTADIPKTGVIGSVTLTIRCDTVKERAENEHIPKDGIILDITQFEIEEGETVYDILKAAAKKNKIHLETSGTSRDIYVKGINNLYEFDFGDLSGWMYRVNGEEPSVSCGEYVLKNGDKIEWLYTCKLGKDLG